MSEHPVFVEHEHPGYVRVPKADVWVLVDDLHIVFDTLRELEDPAFLGRRHGTRHIKNEGCDGPLCKKVLREWMRERRGYKPRPRVARWDELLDKFLQVHYTDLQARKQRHIQPASRILLLCPILA